MVLLALTPALWSPVGPPGVAVFVILAHLHPVRAAPALGRLSLPVSGLNPQGKALQHCLEACQQPAFVSIAQGQLHLAAAQLQVHIDAGRRLGKWWGGDCGLRLCALASGASLQRGLGQLPCPASNGRTEAMLAEVVGCLLIVAAR